MAPKRSSLLEDPPAASSSEEEVESEEEEEEDEEEEPAAEGGAADYESDSSDFDKSPKKPNLNAAPKPQTPSSSDSDNDDEDGNESDSDDFDKSPKKPKPSDLYRTSTPIVKPKPITETPKPKKTVAKPTASTATSAPAKPSAAGKRPLESEKAEKEKEKDSKRKKKKVGDGEDEDDSHPKEGENKSFEDFMIQDHKNPFQRLWSDDDEIVILKGMSDCIKKGIDPTSDLDEFLDSIKKSIHVNVNRDQLNNKIRRLKKKYLNNVKRGKEGEDPVFSKPHDLKSFELMKEIWGGQDSKEGKSKKSAEANNGNDDSTLTNGKRSRNPKPRSGAASPKPKTIALADIPTKESPKLEEKNWSLYPCLYESLRSNKNSTKVGESLLKEGLSSIGESKAKELEQKWRKLQAAELEIHLKRVELEREQMMAVLNALKPSDS
ncbi:Protein of unknown function DUF573 [Macleaya cordata]|uniref:Glabrous enhancer-binding protein-like DBD domain-containing protein n=1 Tax=Macleaya cordata TaxID=56857 RepID=A0A200QRU2_MACCD|nr:Protein of unknown function DUF573 [Macleaya cordata]